MKLPARRATATNEPSTLDVITATKRNTWPHCAALLAIAGLAACRIVPPSGDDSAPDRMGVETRAAAPFGQEAPLPPRADVTARSDALAARAARERSEAAAKGYLREAASLRERLFRTGHDPEDARGAAALLREEGSCDAMLQRAALLGEAASSALVTARETSDVARAAAERGDATCSERASHALRDLGPFAALGLVEPQGAAPRPFASASRGVEAMETALASPDQASLGEGPAASLLGLETFGHQEGARVVLRLSAPASFRLGAASGAGEGRRLVLDLDRVSLARAVPRQRDVGGVLTRVRLTEHGDSARVVLDLGTDAYRRVFYLPEPFRIVVDVTTRAPRAFAADRTPGARREVQRVVLDPGHGGVDPGAVGPSGQREKDITLDVAHRAAPVLARELGVATLLTRDDDSTVPLEARTGRANAFGADLFVSLHCNASESPSARGVQTFVLDTSSDAVAARIAARENAASPAAGAVVARLVADLKLADLGTRSTHFAELLQRATVTSLAARYPGVHNQGVERAGFYVLVGAQMPAALFEMSYLSNATEEDRLSEADYRQRLADAIVNAVRAYRDGL
jgi:N-acetylmuramoyl-L-alanine amidase